MSNDLFSVSIKGIVYQNGNYLLRKNQRNEYELIGGRLEPEDHCPEDRLKKEFTEEAGAIVKVLSLRDPWLYLVGQKNIIIVPYLCELESIKPDYEDIDGGHIKWIPKDGLDAIFIPDGYVDSIYNAVPRKSFSKPKGEFFRIIPNYREIDYYIQIRVFSIDGTILMQEFLKHYQSPTQIIENNFDIKYSGNFHPLSVEKEQNTTIISYIKLY